MRVATWDGASWAERPALTGSQASARASNPVLSDDGAVLGFPRPSGRSVVGLEPLIGENLRGLRGLERLMDLIFGVMWTLVRVAPQSLCPATAMKN